MANVYLVDDDADVRESLGWMLSAVGIEAELFESAAAFLSALKDDAVGVAVLDVNMPQMDGIALQAQLKQQGSMLSLVFLTGYATVPKAVQALQAGAMDFLEKPVAGDKLIDLIRQGIIESESRHQAQIAQRQLAEKVASLTEREAELMSLVVSGQTNKSIAATLFIAQRTVEIHRKNLFEKMEVSNAAELALLIGRFQQTEADSGKT